MRRSLQAFVRFFFEVFARSVLRFYCSLEVTGRENLPAVPFLFCSNHASHMDSVVLMIAARAPFHRFGLVAARDYFLRTPLVYYCYSCMVKLLPMERRPTTESLGQTLELCRQFLRDSGRGIIMFPEGTRSISGEIGTFKRGAALFASKLELPIVPAFIDGTRTAMRKGRFLPRPTKITVCIGKPITNANEPGNVALSQVHSATMVSVRSRILALKEDRTRRSD